jgi:long-subunit fatty acid transport protein
LNDYNRAISIQGNNSESSMLDYQADILNDNSNQADGNAYFRADALYYNDENKIVNDYQYPVSNYGAEQFHQLVTDGYAGEYDFNVSGNYNDVLFVGATMAFQHINYDQTTFHSETPFNDIEATSIPLHTFSSYDYLNAIGNGFSFKMGLLYKITHELRIGAAFHTPTYYNFRYDYWTNVYATVEYDDGVFNNTGESPVGYYEWDFKAPARYILSSSYVIGNVGVVSGEIEYLNYSNMNISANDYYFGEENQNIKNIYDGAVNARLGAEVKMGIASLRGGFGYLDSPYKSTEPNSKAYKLLFSGGLGINMGIAYFEAAYQYITGDEYYYMYGYENSKVDISNRNHKFMTTIGMRF